MKFAWDDYSVTYKDVVESWLDEDAKKFTGCDDGFEEYYNYWANEADTKPGENFWAKMILKDKFPVGVLVLGLWEHVLQV